MHFVVVSLFTLSILSFFKPLGNSAYPLLEMRANGIDQTTYNNLERYAKYSSAAYQPFCAAPLGHKLVKQFSEHGADGFVARDGTRKEIVVVFRGTSSITDVLIDLQSNLTSLKSPGIAPAGTGACGVHSGFQSAYNNVATDLLKTVTAQLASFPTYSLVVTGHSLGGALASIAALSIEGANPNISLKLYTYGQPRTGNAAFASLVENKIGTANIFRAVHTIDRIPKVLTQTHGYRHFATEYWNFKDPANAANVKKCNGGEDPSCSDSFPSTSINPAHALYFGQVMSSNPLLCILGW